jgi:hypothetical protein
MAVNYYRWQKLFLWCLGIFIAAAFCMKWMENRFISNAGAFTVIGLEITYSAERISQVLNGINDHVRTLLRFHLSFDFVFMAGVYPGIAALCMMAREKTNRNRMKSALIIFAALQLAAWVCDISENIFLLKWIETPDSIRMFQLFHAIVIFKWSVALIGVLLAIFILAANRRKKLT